jgi:hypothetical protein
MQYLRQSTASQEISLGPFLDSTDGDTEENGLTIANTDIKLRKGGTTTLANKNSGGATSISNGVYHATLDATDSNTLGMLEVYVHVAGALSVKNTYMVIPAASYDAIVTNGLNDIAATAVVSAGAITTSSGSVSSVTTTGTATTVTDGAKSAELAKVPKSDGTSTWNATALASINAECDTALTDYDGPTNAEMNARTLLAANYATSAAQITAQSDLDIITGADGAILLSGTQASVDAIEADTAAMQPQVAKIPLSDGVITWNSTALASINAECDTALTDYDAPTNTEMEARTLIAANYATSAAHVVSITGNT